MCAAAPPRAALALLHVCCLGPLPLTTFCALMTAHAPASGLEAAGQHAHHFHLRCLLTCKARYSSSCCDDAGRPGRSRVTRLLPPPPLQLPKPGKGGHGTPPAGGVRPAGLGGGVVQRSRAAGRRRLRGAHKGGQGRGWGWGGGGWVGWMGGWGGRARVCAPPARRVCVRGWVVLACLPHASSGMCNLGCAHPSPPPRAPPSFLLFRRALKTTLSTCTAAARS